MADSSLKRQADASPPHQRQRKTTRTESGGDTSEQGSHDINAKIFASLPAIVVERAQDPSDGVAFLALRAVLNVSPSLRIKKETSDETILMALATHPEYVENIRSCILSKNFDRISTLPFIETVKPSPMGPSTSAKDEDGGRSATIKSWGEHYIGSAASCLFQVMTQHHNFVGDVDPYSRHLSIVQSSGTGKSRMIDELSKKHLVIPVNLREAGTTGYPPADGDARDFLLKIPLYRDPAIYYTAYLIALFEITSDVIETIQSRPPSSSHPIEEDVALQFRAFMTEPSNSSAQARFNQYGESRTNFYNRVVARANELVPGAEQDTGATAGSKMDQYVSKQEGPRTPPSTTKPLLPESPDTKYKFPSSDLMAAARALISLIKPQINTKTYDKPLIILSFDEAHSLAQPSDHSEELFFTLRRVLRRLRQLPIFALFLSTTSNIQYFSPPVKQDRSSRVLQERLKMFPPYMELGFDQFAEKLRDGARTIHEVSQRDYMVKFGRPLFATRYKYGREEDRDDIVYFALRKLAGTGHVTTSADTNLACMAVRLALQFNATTMEAQYREKQQVSDHMRICLSVDEKFESMVTVAPSEPILAEAARLYMQRSDYSLPTSLLNELKTPGLDKGDRGELIALVLLILACDRASIANGRAAAFPLLDFFENLFPAQVYAEICEAMPSKERSPDEWRKFGDTFRDSMIYFNHFVKVNDDEVVNRKFLRGLIQRGGAVLCKNGQFGIDVILPFLSYGDRLHSQNVGGILIQIKNIAKLTKLAAYLFDAINPYTLGFFDEDEENPVPIIRMVFSLGSPGSAVIIHAPVRRQPSRKAKSNALEKVTVKSKARQSKGKGPAKAGGQATTTEHVKNKPKKKLFTAFDIWCAGARSDTFAVIKPDEENTYAQLLKISKTFPAAYESKVPEAVVLRKQMNPGTSSDPEHWQQFSVLEDLPEELPAEKVEEMPAKTADEDDYESDNSDSEDATDEGDSTDEEDATD